MLSIACGLFFAPLRGSASARKGDESMYWGHFARWQEVQGGSTAMPAHHPDFSPDFPLWQR